MGRISAIKMDNVVPNSDRASSHMALRLPRILRSMRRHGQRFLSTIKSVPHCPAPSCQCPPKPPLVRDKTNKILPIDRSQPLAFTMSPFSHQILICTSRDQWPSRIEDGDPSVGGELKGNLAAEPKKLRNRRSTQSGRGYAVSGHVSQQVMCSSRIGGSPSMCFYSQHFITSSTASKRRRPGITHRLSPAQL